MQDSGVNRPRADRVQRARTTRTRSPAWVNTLSILTSAWFVVVAAKPAQGQSFDYIGGFGVSQLSAKFECASSGLDSSNFSTTLFSAAASADDQPLTASVKAPRCKYAHGAKTLGECLLRVEEQLSQIMTQCALSNPFNVVSCWVNYFGQRKILTRLCERGTCLAGYCKAGLCCPNGYDGRCGDRCYTTLCNRCTNNRVVSNAPDCHACKVQAQETTFGATSYLAEFSYNCNSSETCCGNKCVSLNMNCTACGLPCPPGKTCTSGTCTCPQGTCGENCATCAANESCEGGQCVKRCPGDQRYCGWVSPTGPHVCCFIAPEMYCKTIQGNPYCCRRQPDGEEFCSYRSDAY